MANKGKNKNNSMVYVGIEQDVHRKLITKFGEKLYNLSEVDAVGIQVGFKDGSAVQFGRCKDEEE